MVNEIQFVKLAVGVLTKYNAFTHSVVYCACNESEVALNTLIECSPIKFGLYVQASVRISNKTSEYPQAKDYCSITWAPELCTVETITATIDLVISLSTLALHSRDWHEKLATKFHALQNTPY